ncbi:hypothetical protein RHSP_29794 [Rhizobium freirei PRF 81]|uniref:Uncharacterized protein n=1 Tax=Rhizobium freirei PRF 81 TaxID=363754 RepID=N6V5Z8_9HYPH|nr:hypothetical protein RHSP_29794 [Rhizobium freirei PRF 81]
MDFLIRGVRRNIFADRACARSVSSAGRVCRRLSASAGLRPPDDIGDVQLLRNDAEIIEFVGQSLLIGDRGIGDDRDTAEIGARTCQGHPRHIGWNTGDFSQCRNRLVQIRLCCRSHFGQFGDDVDDDLRIALGEIAICQEIAEGVDDTARGCEYPGIRIGLGDCEIGIPDRPGIDGASLEGGRGVRRREIERLDVVDRQTALAQRLDGDVMRARTALEGDLLALEVGKRLDRRALANQNGRAFWAACIKTDIEQVAVGGLRKERRHIAGGAEIEGAGAKRFEQRRTGCEFRPFDGYATIGKPLFQRALAFGERQHAVFLPAYAKRRRGCRPGRPDRRQCEGDRRGAEEAECLSARNHRGSLFIRPWRFRGHRLVVDS